MMVLAQENSVGDVGAAAVSGPVLDVVGFAPGGWTFAAGPAASAIALGECDALAGGEEALLATDVERLAVLVKDDSHGALGAGETFDGLDRDGLLCALESSVSCAGDELLLGDRHPHRGGTRAQELTGLDLGTGGHELVEHVGGELFGAARVVDDAL